MTTVHPALARFAADLNDAYEKVCNDPAHEEYFRIFEGTSIKLFTVDGLTAEFYEEGIEFYPKDSK